MPDLNKEPFFVETDTEGCPNCGCNRTYRVVCRVTDTSESVTYDDKDEAERLAERLNAAFQLGTRAERVRAGMR